jgi:hypothetical protein
MKKLILFTLLATVLARPDISAAANSRDYIPLPAGSFFFGAYFKHISANTLFADGKKVSNDFNLNANLGIFRPVYYANIGNALYGDGGLIVDPQALIVFGEQHLDGAAVGGANLSDTGLADSTVLATFWFVNAPKEKFWVGFSPYITMPIGHYNKNRTFNIGNNRWAFKPELGVVKGFGERFYADFIVNGEFYTDNDDFFNGVTHVKKAQDPVLGIETHLSYDITKQWYISLDYFYNYGGETKIAGVRQNDELSNHGLGASLFWMIGSSNQLMIEYRNDFSVKSGAGTDTFGARWAYFF